MKVLSAEINLETPTNLGNSTVVRVYNSDSSAGTITKKDVAGNTLGTITVPSGEVVYCEKKYTDTLEGGVTLKASQIAYSNMMYYASAAIAEVPDTTNPTLISSSPANNATEVAVDSNIILNFSEPVDAEGGYIFIYKESDDSLVEAIVVTSGQVTGSGTNQITINPSSDLTDNETFYIIITSNAFDDASGNSYEGILDKTSLSFTTAAGPDYVTDNLVFHIDAGDTNSYSGIGTTVNSLVGSITNSSYNSNINHSTSDGGYWSFVASGPGKTGTGIEFDLGSFPSSHFMPLGSSDMTYEVWMKPTGFIISPFGLYRTTLSNSTRNTFAFFLQVPFVAGIVVWAPYPYNNFFESGPGDYSNNIWQHLVFTHDNSEGRVKVYVNGSKVKENLDSTRWGFYAADISESHMLRVGIGGDESVMEFSGDISIVRIYKGKELSSFEVTKNFNAEKARYGYS